MGSWNHTCAVTNLPIYHGDEVEVILLASSNDTYEQSFCYPTAYYSPIPLTFHGKYNDYGDVEDCEGVALDIVVESLRNSLYEMEAGENEYHDIAAKKDEFNIDKLFELDHEERLYIKNNARHPYDTREKVRIKHIVVIKEVYDSIVESLTFESWTNLEIVNVSLETFNDEYEQFIKDLDVLCNHADEIEAIKMLISSRIGDTRIGSCIGSSNNELYNARYPVNVMEEIKTLFNSGSDKLKGLIDNALRFYMFNTFIIGSRKSWHVPSGVGSQDDNVEYQELCANLTLLEVEKTKKRFEDE